MSNAGRRDDGGPAFPRTDGPHYFEQSGMTLRDYFAGQILTGIISRIDLSEIPIDSNDVRDADFLHEITTKAYNVATWAVLTKLMVEEEEDEAPTFGSERAAERDGGGA